MSEAIFNTEDILEVNDELVERLKKKALESDRKRFRLCLHKSLDDLTQEMLIVFAKGTFMPPHRHLASKSESYHIVEGSMIVYFFDNEGNVKRSFPMEAPGSNKTFLYRLSANEWHMPLITSDILVYHEARTGPFERENDVEFPSWAPEENNQEAIQQFLKSLAQSH